jgi:succinoglycan biosynthesis protein ExoO
VRCDISSPELQPRVSVVMPTYNCAAYVVGAIQSALGQTLQPIEVIVIDDGSTDGTISMIGGLATGDPRVRLEKLARNCGPAAARNRGFALARAPWIAVLDSDDSYVPDRLERLLKIGEEEGADIVADNLLQFTADDPASRTPYLTGVERGWLSLQTYLKEARLFGGGRDFGYLKPVFRAEPLRTLKLEYDERLRIAEDDDLALRALAAGLRYWYEPIESYLYRRHSSSTSHRLTVENAKAMCAASSGLVERLGDGSAGRLLRARHAALVRGWAFVSLVDAIKEKHWLDCARIAVTHPNAIPLLRMPLAAALSRGASRLGSAAGL